MLSIVSILALFTAIDAHASEQKVLCLLPQSAHVYTEEDKVYTISKDDDVFYTDRIEDDFVYIADTDLKIKKDDVLIGNDVISYLKKSNIEVQASVCVDSADIKPVGKKSVIASVPKGTVFCAQEVTKYSVKILYEEELCFLKRSNVHLQYYLHDLEIPEYGLCDADKIVEELENATTKLSELKMEAKTLAESSDIRSAITEYALTFVGNEYVWGGTNPYTGADCSGFVGYVYRQFGYNLPRCSYEQCDVGTAVDRYTAQPGDLVFFWKEDLGRVGHVGMYLGNNRMVEAKSASCGIVTSDLDWDKVYIARSYL